MHTYFPLEIAVQYMLFIKYLYVFFAFTWALTVVRGIL